MMKKYEQPVEINHNENWLYIANYPYISFIIESSGSEKLMCYWT